MRFETINRARNFCAILELLQVEWWRPGGLERGEEELGPAAELQSVTARYAECRASPPTYNTVTGGCGCICSNLAILDLINCSAVRCSAVLFCVGLPATPECEHQCVAGSGTVPVCLSSPQSPQAAARRPHLTQLEHPSGYLHHSRLQSFMFQETELTL